MVHIIGQSRPQSLSKDQLLSDPKIQSVDVVSDSIHFLRRQRPLVKVGVYAGRFPVITPKDAVFLSLCRTQCEMLIILLESDYSVRLKKEKSLVQYPAKERAFTVASLPFVDWICIYDEETPDLAVSNISPSVIFHGLYSDDSNIFLANKEKLVRIEHPFEVEPMTKKLFKFFDLPTGG